MDKYLQKLNFESILVVSYTNPSIMLELLRVKASANGVRHPIMWAVWLAL